MDLIDPDRLDGSLETERQWLVTSLRRIADRMETLSTEDIVEPLIHLSDDAEAFIRRADTLLRIPLGSPPSRRS